MNTIPEPALIPPEYPAAPLRCCLCQQPVEEALELLYGPICRPCLQEYADAHTMDELSALLCAAILTDNQPQKEDLPCCQNL